MKRGYCVLGILLLAVLAGAGCLSAIFPNPPGATPTPAPSPTAIPVTNSLSSTIPVSQMALQPSDLPSGYILKDRSDITYPEMDQISLNLGWRAGYRVTYYRLNEQQYDMTEISQVIELFTPINMNAVFNIQEDAINTEASVTSQIYELPCPNMGDHTFAYRKTETQGPLSLTTYGILFTKKDVYEELTMSGTTTDFEALKDLARTSAGKIQ